MREERVSEREAVRKIHTERQRERKREREEREYPRVFCERFAANCQSELRRVIETDRVHI